MRTLVPASTLILIISLSNHGYNQTPCLNAVSLCLCCYNETPGSLAKKRSCFGTPLCKLKIQIACLASALSRTLTACVTSWWMVFPGECLQREPKTKNNVPLSPSLKRPMATSLDPLQHMNPWGIHHIHMKQLP